MFNSRKTLSISSYCPHFEMTPVSTACSCPCCLGVVQGWCGRYGPGSPGSPGSPGLHWLQGTVYTSLQGPDPGGQSTLGVWWLNGSVNLQYFHRAPPVSAIISCTVYGIQHSWSKGKRNTSLRKATISALSILLAFLLSTILKENIN